MTGFIKETLPLVGKAGLFRYLGLGLLSGLSNFGLLQGFNRAIAQCLDGSYTAVREEYLVGFAAILLLFVWSRRALAFLSVELTQRISWTLRNQILATTLKADYEQLAGRKTKIQSAILHDVRTLTDASMVSIELFIQVIVSVACLAYLATLSGVLFGVTLAVAGAGMAVYYVTARANMHDLETARQLENRFQALQNMILDGFKEIFLEPRKGQYLYGHQLRENARDSYRHNTRALTSLVNNQMIGQVLFNGLVTVIVLVFSVKLRMEAADLVAYVFTLLYLSGAIAAVMVMLPTLMRAGVSVNHLTQLRAELETARFTNAAPEQYRFREAFDGITVRGLAFRYGTEAAAFGIGPVDLRVNRGETVFIYGGNGSGKTTFFNALVGLCTPTAGEIRVNGTAVDARNYADYRSLFAVVFNDFYLFEELPGFPVVDPVQWESYLRLFELEGKVTLRAGRFSTTDLSTGQRKRLALILALLEQKPVVALDEWAADQDPYFRRKFYTEILPHLKGQGFTVVAITHDDTYYGCADKLYKMNEGKLAEEAAGTPAFGLPERTTPGPSLQKGGEPCPAAVLTGKGAIEIQDSLSIG